MTDCLDLSALSGRVTAWLMEEYECVEVPAASLPPDPSEYKPNYDPGPGKKVKYFQAAQIDFHASLPIDKPKEGESRWEASAQLAVNMDRHVELFKQRIKTKLSFWGWEKGDTLYIREWPIILHDPTGYRQRRFNFYGWTEIFYVPVVEPK